MAVLAFSNMDITFCFGAKTFLLKDDGCELLKRVNERYKLGTFLTLNLEKYNSPIAVMRRVLDPSNRVD